MMKKCHPDKRGDENKCKILNEMRSKLRDPVKRANYKMQVSNSTLSSFFERNDIVAIRNWGNFPKYNGMHGHVMEVPRLNPPREKYTIKLQHRRLQFDACYEEEGTILTINGLNLSGVYGVKERKESKERWSIYYPKGARVLSVQFHTVNFQITQKPRNPLRSCFPSKGGGGGHARAARALL